MFDEYIPLDLRPGDTRKFKGPQAPAPPPPPSAPVRAGDPSAGVSGSTTAGRLAKRRARARAGISNTVFAGEDPSQPQNVVSGGISRALFPASNVAPTSAIRANQGAGAQQASGGAFGLAFARRRNLG